jgi:hypothetical protein
MLQYYLIENIWFALGLWALVYTSDYYLTLYGAKVYHQKASQFIVYEGSYELTPEFEDDIDNQHRFSPRFLVALVFTSLIFLFIWYVVQWGYTPAGLFLFGYGAFFLREVAVHMRHFRGILLYKEIKNKGGVEGNLTYSRNLLLQLSAYDLISFGFLYLLIYALSGGVFYLGGAVACIVTGLHQLRFAAKAQTN